MTMMKIMKLNQTTWDIKGSSFPKCLISRIQSSLNFF